ncbi:MAG: hypothetical protein ACP5G1_02380 [Nanopusillaceae archaeon]
MYHKRSQVSNFLVLIILFIVALVLLVIFSAYYFKGGANLFNSVNQTNGTHVISEIQGNVQGSTP